MRRFVKMDVLRFKDTPELRRSLNPFWFTFAKPLAEGETFYSIEMWDDKKGIEFRSCRLFPIDLLALRLVAIEMETA